MKAIDPTNVTMEVVRDALNHPLLAPHRDPEREAFERWRAGTAIGLYDPVVDLLFRAFMAGTAHGLETALERIKKEM